MDARIGINGFGRIGRSFLRVALEQELDVVAINDLTDTRTLAHHLAFDSTYGRLRVPVTHDESSITVDGRRIMVTAESDPARLDWAAVGADIVMECTGRFRKRDAAALHLRAEHAKVLLSSPGKNVDATIVMESTTRRTTRSPMTSSRTPRARRTVWHRWRRSSTTLSRFSARS